MTRPHPLQPVRRRLGVWLAALVLAAPVLAQTGGSVRGKVIDGRGQPVENARVVVEVGEGGGRRQEALTDGKGEFVYAALAPGTYRITADKTKLGSQAFEVKVRPGQMAEVNFMLVPGSSPLSEVDVARSAEMKELFAEGVRDSDAGRLDAALEKFDAAFEIDPSCYDCLYNVGHVQLRQKQYDKAEAAFRKTLEMKDDYAAAYDGLASVYNAQRKFEQAAAASEKATQLGSQTAGSARVEALYNQGVILWNAGKVADARKQFEAAIETDPGHADSHYQLAMTLINQGNVVQAVIELETYLRLAPDGPFAQTARTLLGQLKKP